jgi:methyl coenzyme M reductase gamma subunit
MEKIETTRSEPAGPEIELEDLALTDEDTVRVKGGATPTNEYTDPPIPGSLNHNETVV